jgi:hypothetical protein
MNTQLDSDPELFELIRSADPMRHPRVQADLGMDTESALRLIAPELDRARVRRRRPPRLRIALLAGAVAVAAFVVANVASTGNGPAVSPAQAKAMIRRAREALLYPSAAILEQDSVTTLTSPDGSTSTSEAHQWLRTSAPYDNRQIIIEDGKVQWEQATVNGRLNVYDPATNTVYLAPRTAPQLVPDNPSVTSAQAEIQYLLGQPGVTVDPGAVLDGAPAIEFTFDGGRFSYWASPSDYRPLQSEDRQDPLPDGGRGVGITRYPIDQVFYGSAASPSLLSLEAQHPGATVDQSPVDYQAALSRLGLAVPQYPAPSGSESGR